MAPAFDRSAISEMVNFNTGLAEETNNLSPFASLGSPWEFNLRDLGRWLQITSLTGQYDLQPLSPVEYLDTKYTGRFRTQADQATSLNICRHFFHASSMSRDHQDMVELPSELVIGHSRLEKPSQVLWTPIVAPLKLPACLFNCAEVLIRCLEVKWLPILTGSEQSGQSSLVKFLAAQRGVQLRVICLHSGTDTSNLIGGFEQSNTERKLIKIIEDICRLIESSLESSYVCRDTRAYKFDMSLRDLNYVIILVSTHKVDFLTSCVLQIFWQLGRDQFSGQFETLEHPLLELETGKSGCRFEWVDGPLVTAMKKGEWLLVKNSNLCSASVLDRLNPLFEGAGRRQLAEKGMTNRGIDTVTPHNDFRIVFAVNPRYGKLSHAMRNRGVEIAFLPDPQFSVWSLPMPLCKFSRCYSLMTLRLTFFCQTIQIPLLSTQLKTFTIP
jgi:midasin